MRRALLLFEDTRWNELRPLTDVIPVPALRFGGSDLARRWRHASGLPLLAVLARAETLAAWSEAPPAEAVPAEVDEVVAVNAAALPGPWLAAALEQRAPSLWLAGDRVAGARIAAASLAPGLARGDGFETWLLSLGLPGFASAATLVAWPWDLIARNTEAIVNDLDGVPIVDAGDVHPTAVRLVAERISIGTGTRVDPFVVLDARDGPIQIGEACVVHAHTVVRGPCVIGAGTELLGGTTGHSTIGPGCRIAGEVDHCVWQGWANKRHHGFVGHSAIGAWVNLGALTTTSDLKNNYGEVRVRIGDREIPTGSNKVGSILGAHVKTGIGTLLPTGAAIGTGANLFGGGRFAPKSVPAFAWWDGERAVEHELERFLATARIAMSRRGRALSASEERVLRACHVGTARERRASTDA